MRSRFLILVVCVLCPLLLAPRISSAQVDTDTDKTSGKIWMITTYYWEDGDWVKHASWDASFLGQDLRISLNAWNWEPEYSGFWARFDNFYVYGDTELSEGLLDDFNDGVISPIWGGDGGSCLYDWGAEACEADGVVSAIIPEGELPPWMARSAGLQTPDFVVHGEFDVYVDFTLNPEFHVTPNTNVKLTMVDEFGNFPEFSIRNTWYQSRAVGGPNYLIRQTHTDHLVGKLRMTRTEEKPPEDPVKKVFDLGTLGGHHSVARAVNDKGKVVGGSVASDDRMHPFRWTKKGGMQDMGEPHPGLHCEARSIDDKGDQGVGRCCADLDGWECESIGDRAFRWNLGAGNRFPEIFANQLCETSTAFGNCGWMTFGGCQSEPGDPMLAGWFSGERFQLLRVISHDFPSVVTAVYHWYNKRTCYAAGVLVTESENSHAFVWPNPEHPSPWRVRDIDTLGGDWSDAWAVNGKGEVAGASETKYGDQHAFLWTPAEGMIDLGTLGYESSALGMNDRGQVVGYSTTLQGQTVAFLWTREDGMVALRSLEGAADSAATDINNNGIVVGATRLEGPDEEYRATMWELK